MQLVLVKWKDATTFGQWESMDFVESSGFKICYASGVLITDNEEKVTVALLASEDKKHSSNWINIPRGSVLELAVIREVDWEVPNG